MDRRTFLTRMILPTRHSCKASFAVRSSVALMLVTLRDALCSPPDGGVGAKVRPRADL